MPTRTLLLKLSVLLLVLFASANLLSYWNHLPRIEATPNSPDALRPKSLTDLYPRWYGTRELLLHHRDPYGAEVSSAIQIAFYGRVLDPSRPNEPRDQQRFAYPLYVVFLLAPTANLNFHTVCIIFWWLLLIATLAGAFFWLRFLGGKISLGALVVILAVLFSSIPVMQGIAILQLGLLVGCLIAAAAFSIVSGRFFLAGALLAVATIKPQLCLLPIAWFVLWALSNWRQRRPLLLGFSLTLAALILGANFLLPGWLLHYPDALRAYAGYTNATSLLGVLFAPTLRWILTAAALLIAAAYCWRARHQPANTLPFAISLGLALTLTVLVVPTVVPPFNHVLLLPVALLAVLHWKGLWRTNALNRVACVTFAGFVFLPWILALLLLFLPATWQQSRAVWSAPLSASLALPFAAFAFLMLLRRMQPALRQAETQPMKLS